MAVDIDPAALDRAREALAAWENQQTPPGFSDRPATGADYAEYDVGTVDGGEWLVFSSSGGYTNRLYLVSSGPDGTVYGFAPTDMTVDDAIAAARDVRDSQRGIGD